MARRTKGDHVLNLVRASHSWRLQQRPSIKSDLGGSGQYNERGIWASARSDTVHVCGLNKSSQGADNA